LTLLFCEKAIAAITLRDTQTRYDFNILLQTLIEYLPFCLYPVFEGMAILSTMLLIQGVGLFRDARMDDLGMFIRLVSNGVLIVP